MDKEQQHHDKLWGITEGTQHQPQSLAHQSVQPLSAETCLQLYLKFKLSRETEDIVLQQLTAAVQKWEAIKWLSTPSLSKHFQLQEAMLKKLLQVGGHEMFYSILEHADSGDMFLHPFTYDFVFSELELEGFWPAQWSTTYIDYLCSCSEHLKAGSDLNVSPKIWRDISLGEAAFSKDCMDIGKSLLCLPPSLHNNI